MVGAVIPAVRGQCGLCGFFRQVGFGLFVERFVQTRVWGDIRRDVPHESEHTTEKRNLASTLFLSPC